MNQEQENRMRRNYVSKMYPYPRWHERVAGMSTEQITAVYLRFIRDDQKLKPSSPEELERNIHKQQDDEDNQLELF